MAESVVDYKAWEKGYMPPSEHILIDALSYRGARVVLSTAVSREHQIWLAVQGPALTRRQRLMFREIMAIWWDDEPETPGEIKCSPATTSPNTSPIITGNASAVPSVTGAETESDASMDASKPDGADENAPTGDQSKPGTGTN